VFELSAANLDSERFNYLKEFLNPQNTIQPPFLCFSHLQTISWLLSSICYLKDTTDIVVNGWAVILGGVYLSCSKECEVWKPSVVFGLCPKRGLVELEIYGKGLVGLS
jgi:hypothetical protein